MRITLSLSHAVFPFPCLTLSTGRVGSPTCGGLDVVFFQHSSFCLPMIGWSIVIHTEKWVRWPVGNGVFAWTDGQTAQIHTCIPTHATHTEQDYTQPWRSAAR